MRLIQPVPPSDKVVPDKVLRLAAPAVLQPFLNAYSIQNGSELTQSPGLANYILVYSEPSSIDAASVRIDHSFGSKLQLFGRYAYTPSGGWYFNDLPIHDNIRVNVQSVTLGATSMITPPRPTNSVSTLRITPPENMRSPPTSAARPQLASALLTDPTGSH